jgi:hypothetical protein
MRKLVDQRLAQILVVIDKKHASFVHYDLEPVIGLELLAGELGRQSLRRVKISNGKSARKVSTLPQGRS